MVTIWIVIGWVASTGALFVHAGYDKAGTRSAYTTEAECVADLKKVQLIADKSEEVGCTPIQLTTKPSVTKESPRFQELPVIQTNKK